MPSSTNKTKKTLTALLRTRPPTTPSPLPQLIQQKYDRSGGEQPRQHKWYQISLWKFLIPHGEIIYRKAVQSLVFRFSEWSDSGQKDYLKIISNK
ncbi:Hypothetical predicted protein [Octopus vulgaris]|uniref:Uncharacterized protein n=1 Tax=Octopus vulgaris TaxID=6645 RepID=A0AA36ARD2_OCTVU|nr:Hypothetical predicted protein [Octopus vulgaris]